MEVSNATWWFQTSEIEGAFHYEGLGDGVRVSESDGKPGSGLDSPLGRMAAMIRSNEQLFDELARLVLKLEGARRYLANPASNRVLGEAEFRRLRTKYTGILTRLRANRVEAQELLRHSPQGTAQILMPRFTPSCLLSPS